MKPTCIRKHGIGTHYSLDFCFSFFFFFFQSCLCSTAHSSRIGAHVGLFGHCQNRLHWDPPTKEKTFSFQ
jgi:hypothetical protein